MQEHKILGIDVGASGMKGAIVDVKTGKLVADRQRVDTPKPATPEAMAVAFAKLVKMHENYEGVVGCGFPAVVKKGVSLTASNIDKSWIGVNIEQIFSEACGCKVFATNDADAAGMAEMTFGAGKNEKGTVLLITLGSGIGTALFLNGRLAPNTEFGHILLHNMIAERYAASSVKDKEGLSWKEWGGRINEYLCYIERILSPDLIIIGGGISRDFENYRRFITTETRVTPAQSLNAAGTVGAALYANKCLKKLQKI